MVVPPCCIESGLSTGTCRKATADDALSKELCMVKLEDRLGSPVWLLRSVTVGIMLSVMVDGTNGEVLEVNRVGVR